MSRLPLAIRDMLRDILGAAIMGSAAVLLTGWLIVSAKRRANPPRKKRKPSDIDWR